MKPWSNTDRMMAAFGHEHHQVVSGTGAEEEVPISTV